MQQSFYERIQEQQIRQFRGHITNTTHCAFCVVSERPLQEPVHNALAASAHALGYSADLLGFVELNTAEDAQPITPPEFLAALETLDPLCVVLTNRASTELASRAYNIALTLESEAYLLGRAARCFENVAALLDTPEGKRRIWNALKTLPRLEQT